MESANIESKEGARELFGMTKNGLKVYFDMVSGHASTHFAHHPKLRAAVERALPTIEATEDVMRVEVDAGEEVGTTDLVETTDEDEVIYALRPLRSQYSRFVKNKAPAPTSWITIDLRKSGEDEYNLYTAYVGRVVPSFPGGEIMPEQSREFWAKHALVLGTQELVPGSETTECPW
jgi:hypothetical protein